MLGSVYSDLEQWQEATDSYRFAISLQPDNGAAYYGLSLIKNSRADESLIEAISKQLRNSRSSPANRSRLSFALGNFHDKREEYDQAATCFQQANQLRWSLADYDVADDLAYFAKLKSAFGPGVFESMRSLEHQSVTPIFIVGLPRSGKSLAEYLLAAHPRVGAAGERHYLRDSLRELGDLQNPVVLVDKILKMPSAKVEQLAQSYLDRIRQNCRGESFVIDTMPVNYYHVGFIRLLFANARIVHCSRQALDLCWFIYRKSFRSKTYDYSYDFDALAAYYRGYQDLIDYWRSVLPEFILELEYERLVSDPEQELSRLLDYVGLEPEGPGLDSYRNAPVHSREIGAWQNYRNCVATLQAALDRDGLIGEG